MSATARGTPAWEVWIPALFVLLWSSGFVACKAGLADSDPFNYLFLRFLAAALILAAVSFAAGARWPTSTREACHIVVAGVLVHLTYLGPNFFAVSRGVPVGINALIGALQPLLTALIASRLLAERVEKLQWMGLTLGLAGILMVLSDKIAFDAALWPEMIGVGVALVSITVGTLYQKHFCGHMDLRSGSALQFAACTLLLAPLAAYEGFRVDWTPRFAVSLAWLVALSTTMYALMHVLFRKGAATRVASLFYLVPPVTSTVAWLFFGEKLGTLAAAGMALTIFGVALATRR